jgi:hypothetical protein
MQHKFIGSSSAISLRLKFPEVLKPYLTHFVNNMPFLTRVLYRTGTGGMQKRNGRLFFKMIDAVKSIVFPPVFLRGQISEVRMPLAKDIVDNTQFLTRAFYRRATREIQRGTGGICSRR